MTGTKQKCGTMAQRAGARCFGGLKPSVIAVVLLALTTGCSNGGAQSSTAPGIDRLINRLSVTHDNRITWNGRSVTEKQFAALLQATRKLDPEPELRFQPDANASYEKSAKVLQIIKESGTSKIGFVGNELYSETENPSD